MIAQILDRKFYKDPRLKESLGLLRSWMGPQRSSRPDNYLNQEAFFNAYLAYYLPQHLPELFWICEQSKKRNFTFKNKRVLDVGAGPGTLALSLCIWLKKEKLDFPEEIVLWDQSERALKFAKDKLKILTGGKTIIRFEKAHLPRLPKEDKKFDLVLMGHVLNEWGAGPRFRNKKLELLKLLMKSLEPQGSLIVVEPPLREPTLDLMVLRDELAQKFQVVAPCPQSKKECPLLRDNLGWCYAQPSRLLFKEHGFLEFDKQLERLVDVQLRHLSFSYLWLSAQEVGTSATNVAVTDGRGSQKLWCTERGEIEKISKTPTFRGEIVLS